MAFTGKLGSRLSRLGNIQLARKPLSIFFVDFDDTLTFSDLEVSSYLLADSFSFTDSVSQVFSFGETLTFSESLSAHHIAVASMTDTLTFNDYFIFPIHDTVTFAEDMSGEVWRVASFTDTVTFSETTTENAVLHQLISELLPLNDTLSKTIIRLLPYTDSVTFADTMSGYRSQPLGDTLTFSDTETEILAKTFHDELDFDGVFTYNAVFHRNWTDQVVLFDSMPYNALIHLNDSDTLVLTDGMSGDSIKPLVPDALTFVETMTETVSIPILETMTFADVFSTNKILNRSLNDNMVFIDSANETHITFSTLDDELTLVDTEKGIRLKFGTMNDSVTFTDHSFRTLIQVLTTDTLTFTDSFDDQEIFNKQLADAILFNEQLSQNMEWNRSIGDTVGFNDGFLVKIIQGTPHPTPPDQVTPIPGGGYQGVVTVFPQVLIVGVTKSIILPAPEFNDYESGQGKIAVLRSMLGDFRVYSKRTDREKVNWHFVLPKFKADELEAFILDEINNDLDITDFKGNKWHAKFLSDSVDFTETGRWEPCGNKVEVTLEFEGVKYA